MVSKDCVAMILAGGQGSRLGALTKNVAKPAVPFGGKYRIIDFPLSNCVHSGINTVGVLTQYQPLELIDISVTETLGIWTEVMAVFMYFLRTKVQKRVNGIKVRQMPFIKT